VKAINGSVEGIMICSGIIVILMATWFSGNFLIDFFGNKGNSLSIRVFVAALILWIISALFSAIIKAQEEAK
jgi:hypothetical protein